MTDLWFPGHHRNEAPSSRWLAITGGPSKGVLHTTEVKAFTPGSSYYGHNGWPHATLAPDGKLWQHIPVNFGAPTLVNLAGGVQTNTDSAVQIEIAWKAAEIKQLPTHMHAKLKEWMRWVEQVRGVQRIAPRFVGPEESPYGNWAKQRFTYSYWDNYGGWCGHQHVPENDHWDPGAIDIAGLLEVTPPAPPPYPPPPPPLTRRDSNMILIATNEAPAKGYLVSDSFVVAVTQATYLKLAANGVPHAEDVHPLEVVAIQQAQET
jgi:hypothetical protein